MTDKVKVAVRVRPLNKRELDLSGQSVVEMDAEQTILHHPAGSLHGKAPKTFAFDHCFWSAREDDSHFAGQEKVFHAMGSGVLENAFKGYNACLFAYGQTGSGKSYTMMGTAEQNGIIPRLCESIFSQIDATRSESLLFKVEITYMEIYNEKVRDLLDARSGHQNLRVREHNIFGPYVEGLSTLAVSSYKQLAALMDEGNKSRTVAATNMNSESSRSHAVFNIRLTQTLVDVESATSGEKVSKISLVDLAGSERVQKSGAVGKRLEEGANINRSLTTLGMVISALAEQSSSERAGARQKFVPYRDSVLTWLLKDNLGGNSKTVMVATVSPAPDNYEETLSTLRYADRAKRIENHAVINEDPNAKIIRELRSEVEALRAQIRDQSSQVDLRERLAESEGLISGITRSWEERLKETERVHRERQTALENMGISVQGAGIMVEHGKFYLVNLNADPSMNELLVYHIHDRSVIGRPGGVESADIQLQGLGIHDCHAVLTIEDGRLFLEPVDGAKTCVNGAPVDEKTALRNGYRVLVGNNHFFKVNCPRVDEAAEEEEGGDYDEALREVMRLEESPVSTAVDALERRHRERMAEQHEADKMAALEEQRMAYERHIRQLRSIISPLTPSDPFALLARTPSTALTPLASALPCPFPNPRSDVQAQFVRWAQHREDMFQQSLQHLKEAVVKANSFVREANLLAAEMASHTSFSVTLQIPAANLKPSKIKKGAFVSEPAVLVKRKARGSQIWSMEKLENKLVDMRDLYQEWLTRSESERANILHTVDPFFESQENHSLIGVANVFLEVLFHDVRLDYQVPIINQQGEVAGRLHVEIYRVLNNELCEDERGDAVDSKEGLATDTSAFVGRTITCRVRIKQATDLPQQLCHFVFCQYGLWSHATEVVPPVLDPSQLQSSSTDRAETRSCDFDHQKDFELTVTDEFLEYALDDTLSIEVWGNKCSGDGGVGAGIDGVDAMRKTARLRSRWAEVTGRLQLDVRLLELSDQGKYAPVEVHRCADVVTGGVCQLRQGQQRRVHVRVSAVRGGGQLPLVPQQISSVAVGCVSVRNRSLQRPLDSYQEVDLDSIKERWSDALEDRRVYLDKQIQRLMNKPDKSEEDCEREQALISQWVSLTEERNAVYNPEPNSSIPGAPSDWQPPAGVEKHIPVIFLDLNEGVNGLVASSSAVTEVAGVHSIIPKEHSGCMISIPILQRDDTEVSATASWDSSIHEHAALNQPSCSSERVYAIVKVALRLSHPADLNVILRKRLCLNVFKRPSIAERLMRRLVGSESVTSTGIQYDLVAQIPKASFDSEDLNTLARVAARDVEDESYMIKYTRGVNNVESILALDRLRQEVAIREMLARQQRRRADAARPTIKRAVSMPNSVNKPSSSAGRRSMGAVETKAAASPTPSDGLELVADLASPLGLTRLQRPPPRAAMAVVDEEQQSAADAVFEAPRSSTVPEALGSATKPPAKRDDSLSSSGYGSQVLAGKAEEAVAFGESRPPRPVAAIVAADDSAGLTTSQSSAMNVSTYSDYGTHLTNVSSTVSTADDADSVSTNGD